MPLTGVFLLPIQQGRTSPSSTLIAHVSRSYPAEPLPPFYLDHRLFVDTSSLLPGSDTTQRKTTSLLTLSHTPSISYVATTTPTKSQTEDGTDPPFHETTLITIPHSSLDSFTQLIGTKLQPQWAHRQNLFIENGTSLSLNEGEWTIRIGDLKTPTRPNQPASNVRAMIVEVMHHNDDGNALQGLNGTQEIPKKTNDASEHEQTLLRNFLISVTETSGVANLTNPEVTHCLIRRTRHDSRHKDDGRSKTSSSDFALAELYLDIIRGPRG
jgi:hypothetical protein